MATKSYSNYDIETQIAALGRRLDKYAKFYWRGEDMWETYHAFITNKDTLKFYNGPAHTNEYSSPQYDHAAGSLVGVKFTRMQIGFTVCIYGVTAQQYRAFIAALGPYEVDYLSFAYDNKLCYFVKTVGVKDSMKTVIGANRDGEDLYMSELNLTFEVQNEQCALAQRQYVWGYNANVSSLIDSGNKTIIPTTLATKLESTNTNLLIVADVSERVIAEVTWRVEDQTYYLNGTPTAGSWQHPGQPIVHLEPGVYTAYYYTNSTDPDVYTHIGFGLVDKDNQNGHRYDRLTQEKYQTFVVEEPMDCFTVLWWGPGTLPEGKTFDNVWVKSMVCKGGFDPAKLEESAYEKSQPVGVVPDDLLPYSELSFGFSSEIAIVNNHKYLPGILSLKIGEYGHEDEAVEIMNLTFNAQTTSWQVTTTNNPSATSPVADRDKALSIKYDSASGLVYLQYGESDYKILDLLLLNTLGEYLITSLSTKKVKISKFQEVKNIMLIWELTNLTPVYDSDGKPKCVSSYGRAKTILV